MLYSVHAQPNHIVASKASSHHWMISSELACRPGQLLSPAKSFSRTEDIIGGCLVIVTSNPGPKTAQASDASHIPGFP